MSPPALPHSEPRSIALMAAARGWMDAATVWDVAQRAERLGSSATLTEVLGASLSEQQLSALQSTPSMQETFVATDSAWAVTEVRPDIDATRAAVRLSDLETSRGPATPEEPSRPKPPRLRYAIGRLLGEGGCGSVSAALDHVTGRTVALKTLRRDGKNDEPVVQRFLREARVTAQLEHPAVVPVYDISTLLDGRPFYTMRIVKQRSLREVLDEPIPRRGWPISRLAAVFVQVCRAMAYAHARGVVHRDLKPENILLGDYGEVYVADWGVAKLLGETEIVEPPVEPESHPSQQTAAGWIMGTIGYMPPEQARGEHNEVDGRSDLFALGVILYELLTGRRPFDAANSFGILYATISTDPPPPLETTPGCPVVLSDLCMRLLAKNKSDRPENAEAVASEVEAFLEAAKERIRQREEAAKLVANAKQHVERFDATQREADLRSTEARAVLRNVKSWEPVESKRPGWALEDAALAAEVEQASALASALEAYTKALGFDPESRDARNGLADLHWSRLLRAEQNRQLAEKRYNETLVRQYDDGRYAALLGADAFVSVQTSRAPADVIAYRYVEHDRVLHAEAPVRLGSTPVKEARIEPGSWLLVLRSPGYRDVRYPIACKRGEHHKAQVNLYSDEEIGHEFVYVPGGVCVIGGDREAHEPLPRMESHVTDFAIAKFPVTMKAYLDYLNALQKNDPEQARRRSPRLEQSSERVAFLDDRGEWQTAWESIVEGDIPRQFAPCDRAGDIPVSCVDWFDALAFARWRSEQDHGAYRLPREVEFEKAARGTDGRAFPWGDRFDPSFCKMRESRPGYAQPEPIGAFVTDESPYGVRDLAGGMQCWAADVEGQLSASDAVPAFEPVSGTPRDAVGMRISRGGAWGNLISSCRSASRSPNFALYRNTYTGIRLARSLG